MNKFFVAGSIAIAILFIVAVIKPFSPKQEPVLAKQTIITTLPSGSEKVEVFVFHATNRCISCVNIGKFTKAVIEEKFSQDLKSGKITFKEINIDLLENRQLAEDYQVSGSSLYITVTKDGQIFKEEDTAVWRYVAYETKFKDYIEAKLKALF